MLGAGVVFFVEPLPFPGGGEQETRGEFAARQHEQAWGCGFQERPLPWGGWCPPTSSSQLGFASSSTRGQIVSSELLSTRTQVATVCLLLSVWAEALVPTSQPGGQSEGGAQACHSGLGRHTSAAIGSLYSRSCSQANLIRAHP